MHLEPLEIPVWTGQDIHIRKVLSCTMFWQWMQITRIIVKEANSVKKLEGVGFYISLIIKRQINPLFLKTTSKS